MTADTLICNRAELAAILKCSLPTLDALIRRYPDFPIRKRGSNGVAWEFVAAEVVAFLEAKKDEESRAEAARSALFEQFRLPIDEIASDDARNLTPQQRASLALARQREHDLAVTAGTLVTAASVREADRRMWQHIGRFFDNLPGQLARFHNLPDQVVRSMRGLIDEERRNFVRAMQAEFALEAQRQDGTNG